MTIARFDYSGRHALVTGATSGIGLGIARGFADAGATVTAVGFGADAVEPHPGIAFAEADVTDQAQLDAVVAACPRVDAVVTCAGIIRRVDEHDPDVFAQVVDVNLTGTMRTLVACKAKLVESGGAAVGIASILTWAAGPLVPGYSASKGGVKQLVQSLATAWAPEGVRVNAIAPGWTATPLTDPLRADPERTRMIMDRVPMKRWAEPADFAGAALFLCSDAAAFITGATLAVDGGYLAD
jgi:NAD(P)-dependent dehydrogenase (short-subunit alcohol dehydrogenase family)